MWNTAIAVGAGVSVGALTYLLGPGYDVGQQREFDSTLAACSEQLTDKHQQLQTLPGYCSNFESAFANLYTASDMPEPFQWHATGPLGTAAQPVISAGVYEVPAADDLYGQYFIPKENIDADEKQGIALAFMAGSALTGVISGASEIERRCITSPRARKLIAETALYLQMDAENRRPPATSD
jgi:hypothetical protein